MGCGALILLVLNLQFSPPTTTATTSAPLAPTQRVRYERLENGLQLVVVEDAGLPLVSVQTWLRVGSADEPPDRPGLADALRRVLVQSAGGADRLRAGGARSDSRTLPDAMYFAALAPAEKLNELLDLEAARLRAATAVRDFDRAEIQSALADQTSANSPQSGVAAFALRSPVPAGPFAAPTGPFAAAPPDPLDRPRNSRGVPLLPAAVWHSACSNLFADHAYAHALQSPPAVEVDAAELNELRRTWVSAAGAFVFIVGDVNPLAVIESVHQRLDALPWRAPPTRAVVDRPTSAVLPPRELTADREHLVMTWLVPGWGYYDTASIDVLMHLLCNPIDGPLYRRLTAAGARPPQWDRLAWNLAGVPVLETGPSGSDQNATRKLAQGALETRPSAPSQPAPSTQPASDDGGAATDAGAPRGLNQLERIVLEELERAAEALPGETALQRARSLAQRDVRDATTNLLDRALRLAAHEVLGGDALAMELELPRLERISVSDVRRAAHLLEKTRRQTLFIRRDANAATNPPAAAGTTTQSSTNDRATRNATSDLLSAFIGYDLSSLGPRAPRHERRTAFKSERDAQASARAPNLDVDIVALPGTPLAVVRACVPRATSRATSAPSAAPGDARRATDRLTTGTKNWSAAQLDDYLSYHGLRMRPVLSSDQVGIEISGPPALVAQMIELCGELLAAQLDERSAGRSEPLVTEPSATEPEAQARESAQARPAAQARESAGVAAPRVRIEIVGDVDVECVMSALAEFWPSAESLSPTSRPTEIKP